MSKRTFDKFATENKDAGEQKNIKRTFTEFKISPTFYMKIEDMYQRPQKEGESNELYMLEKLTTEIRHIRAIIYAINETSTESNNLIKNQLDNIIKISDKFKILSDSYIGSSSDETLDTSTDTEKIYLEKNYKNVGKLIDRTINLCKRLLLLNTIALNQLQDLAICSKKNKAVQLKLDQLKKTMRSYIFKNDGTKLMNKIEDGLFDNSVKLLESKCEKFKSDKNYIVESMHKIENILTSHILHTNLNKQP